MAPAREGTVESDSPITLCGFEHELYSILRGVHGVYWAPIDADGNEPCSFLNFVTTLGLFWLIFVLYQF